MIVFSSFLSYSYQKGKKMFAKKLFILGSIIILTGFFLHFAIIGIKNIKVDNFNPAAAIFLIDASSSNQENIEEQKNFIKQLCKTMDPEDTVKIIRVDDDAYLIYEGSSQNGSSITKSLNSFTQYSSNKVQKAYGEAIKKAVSHCLSMKKEGYIPAIIVVGNLEEKGNESINWNTLPKNIKKTQKYIPELTMMFVWAHPSKLDYVKEKLTPILGEEHLIIATKETVDKVSRKFYNAIGR